MLHRLARARHVHAVRQVGPLDARVLGLLLEHLIGAHAHQPRDVIILRGAHRGVHQHHARLAHILSVQRASEELIVRAVHRVAALERNHILAAGQPRAHSGRRGARELASGQLEAKQLAAQIVLAALLRDHAHARVLQAAGAVAQLRLLRLVGLVLAADGQHGQLLALVRQKHLRKRMAVPQRLTTPPDSAPGRAFWPTLKSSLLVSSTIGRPNSALPSCSRRLRVSAAVGGTGARRSARARLQPHVVDAVHVRLLAHEAVERRKGAARGRRTQPMRTRSRSGARVPWSSRTLCLWPEVRLPLHRSIPWGKAHCRLVSCRL